MALDSVGGSYDVALEIMMITANNYWSGSDFIDAPYNVEDLVKKHAEGEAPQL